MENEVNIFLFVSAADLISCCLVFNDRKTKQELKLFIYIDFNKNQMFPAFSDLKSKPERGNMLDLVWSLNANAAMLTCSGFWFWILDS